MPTHFFTPLRKSGNVEALEPETKLSGNIHTFL